MLTLCLCVCVAGSAPVLSLPSEATSAGSGSGPPPAPHSLSPYPGPLSAQDKLCLLNAALDQIDAYFVSSTVSKWFNLDKTMRLERVIINLLANARTDELNHLVSHVKLGLLFYKVRRALSKRGGRQGRELVCRWGVDVCHVYGLCD